MFLNLCIVSNSLVYNFENLKFWKFVANFDITWKRTSPSPFYVTIIIIPSPYFVGNLYATPFINTQRKYVLWVNCTKRVFLNLCIVSNSLVYIFDLFTRNNIYNISISRIWINTHHSLGNKECSNNKFDWFRKIE